MNTQAIKGRALAALMSALTLLVIIIFLSRAGKTPILLGLVAIVLAVYGLQTLRKLKTLNKSIRTDGDR
ncbi:MAG: hypothetical protein AAB776_02730 [Patescibacteria group bacterium]